MLDDNIISHAMTKGKISERELIGLRLLTTCNNWKKVNPIGIIDHKTVLTVYKGMLVELDKHAYFVRQEVVDAIKKSVKWNVTRVIKIE